MWMGISLDPIFSEAVEIEPENPLKEGTSIFDWEGPPAPPTSAAIDLLQVLQNPDDH